MSRAMLEENTDMKRRTFVKSGVAVASLPAFATVVSGSTESGNVEIETDLVLPDGTLAEITAFENTSGDESPENEQTITLDDGVNTYEYDELSGFIDSGAKYHFEVYFESDSSGEETPELDSMTVTLPEKSLSLNTRDFVIQNQTIPYDVTYYDGSETMDVTDEANVTVENSSILALNEDNRTIKGGGYNSSTNMTVEYDNMTIEREITVATLDVENISLLPPMRKLETVLTDRASQVILISSLTPLVVTKLTNKRNAWISLACSFGIIVLAGFQGWVDTGIVFAGLFFVILASLLISNVRQNEVSVVNESD